MFYNWIGTQNQNYKIKKNSMNDENKYNLWTCFLEKYKYLKTSNDKWYEKFEELKEFIDKNKKRPNIKSEKTLTNWLSDQNKYYKNKKHSMSNIQKYELWTKFIIDYKEE